MKRKIFLISIAIMLMITMFTTYAWFINLDTSPSFSIKSAKISAKIQLYEGVDFNHDGFLDLKNNNDGYEECFETKPEWVLDSTNHNVNSLSLNMTSILPNEIYTFKINIINLSDIDAYIKVTLDDSYLKWEYIDLFVINIKDEKDTLYQEANNIIYGGTSSDIIKKPELIDNEIKYYDLDLLVTIKLLDYDALKNQMSLEEYNQYQGNISKINFFTIILTSSLE